MLESITLQDIMTLGGSAGAVIIFLALTFKAEIKVFLTSRGSERRQILTNVQALQVALEAHITEEKGFWDKQTARVEKVEQESHALELQLAALTATASAQHEAVLGKLADLAEAVRDLRRPG